MNEVNGQLKEVFQALSDTTRFRIISLMIQTGIELCLCDFREAMEEPEYKLSRQLKVLKNAGLISSKRDGKWIYHSLIKEDEAQRLILRAIESQPMPAQIKKDLARYEKRKVRPVKGPSRFFLAH